MSLALRQICPVAEKLQPAIDDLKAVLGVEVCHIDPGVEKFGVENALVAMDTNFIEVVAPITEKTAAGRGEGLGGIDIEAADSARLLKAADDRGFKVSDIQVMICGVRFNPV